MMEKYHTEVNREEDENSKFGVQKDLENLELSVIFDNPTASMKMVIDLIKDATEVAFAAKDMTEPEMEIALATKTSRS